MQPRGLKTAHLHVKPNNSGLHQLHAEHASFGLVAVVRTWKPVGIAVGVVVAKHAIHFRAGIVPIPEVPQNGIADTPTAVPPPPGHRTSVTETGVVVIGLITAISRDPASCPAVMADLGPGVETTCR